MAQRQHALKRSAQTLNNSSTNTPIKSAQNKISKLNNTPKKAEDERNTMEGKLDELHDMMKIVMTRLNKLEIIEERMKKVEDGFKDLRESIDFAHAEVLDLKEDNKMRKIKDEEVRVKIEKLEEDNAALKNSVIDLKARSMRNNFTVYLKRKWDLRRLGKTSKLTARIEWEGCEEMANHDLLWRSLISSKIRKKFV